MKTLIRYILNGNFEQAFLLGFTSDFIPTQLYIHDYGNSFENYITYTYSSFLTKDYNIYLENSENPPEICYYKAKHFNHNHKNKYNSSVNHWKEIIYRFVFVFLFEVIKINTKRKQRNLYRNCLLFAALYFINIKILCFVRTENTDES